MPSETRPLPILSICIATLNRAAYIPETLTSIIGQLRDDVELVILDGASTDGTEALLREAAKGCPGLRYIRLPINSGVDRDYDKAVESCAGEYVWLMTDDDLLLPGAVERVVLALRDQPSLVIVNAEVRNQNMSRVIQSRRLPMTRDQTYTSATWDAFLAQVGDYLSFIGCVVIKRSLWLERDKTTYFGTLFIHVGVIFQQTPPAQITVIAQPYISIRYGNAMWRPRQFEIWMFKWPNLIWSFPTLSAKAKAAVCAAEPWRSLKTLLLYRAKGSYTLVEYHRWIEPRMGSWWRSRLAALLACIPGSLLNMAALLYGKATGQGSGTGSIDLMASRYYFRNWLARSGK